MTFSETTQPRRSTLSIVLWIVQVLLALLFIFAGGMKLVMPLEKLAGPPGSVVLPGAFVRFIGVAELLGGIGLVLPALLRIKPGLTPLAAAGLVIIMIGAVYAAFLLMQTRAYRRYFIQPELGSLTIPLDNAGTPTERAPVDRGGIVIHSVLLVALMLPIVLLAHDLALVIDLGIAAAGAPLALGGVLIAIIVFTPESITAIKAALDNQLQRSINLCLGAFVSTVGLTVPAVLIVGLVTGKRVVMGVTPSETVLLLLTVGLTTLTFLGQRASALQGTLHLTLFAVFGVLLFVT